MQKAALTPRSLSVERRVGELIAGIKGKVFTRERLERNNFQGHERTLHLATVQNSEWKFGRPSYFAASLFRGFFKQGKYTLWKICSSPKNKKNQHFRQK